MDPDNQLSPKDYQALASDSPLVEQLLGQLRQQGSPAPVREHPFHPLRKWRFDLAWPDLHVAAEIDGGTWTGGRHTRGDGYERDCKKINSATLAGWQVYRFTAGMVHSGQAALTLYHALKEQP